MRGRRERSGWGGSWGDKAQKEIERGTAPETKRESMAGQKARMTK